MENQKIDKVSDALKEQAAERAAQLIADNAVDLEQSLAELLLIRHNVAELIAAIEAIELNPLATTPCQHVEFTKRDAVDAVKRWIKEKQ